MLVYQALLGREAMLPEPTRDAALGRRIAASLTLHNRGNPGSSTPLAAALLSGEKSRDITDLEQPAEEASP